MEFMFNTSEIKLKIYKTVVFFEYFLEGVMIFNIFAEMIINCSYILKLRKDEQISNIVYLLSGSAVQL